MASSLIPSIKPPVASAELPYRQCRNVATQIRLNNPMDDHNPKLNLREFDLQRLQLFLCLVPVFGFFPAVWTLYCRQGSPEQQRVSRLAVTLALLWLTAYGSLATATGLSSELLTIRMLYIEALLTSGYFLLCVGLMVKLWQCQSLRLPGVSYLAEHTVRRYLSK
jgi:hypothetical protein